MRIEFITREHGPKNLIAEAEIHFQDGIDSDAMTGLKLIGFTLWKTEGGNITVTLPSRSWGDPGGRKFFDLLRAGDGGSESVRRIKASILAAYEAQRGAS